MEKIPVMLFQDASNQSNSEKNDKVCLDHDIMESLQTVDLITSSFDTSEQGEFNNCLNDSKPPPDILMTPHVSLCSNSNETLQCSNILPFVTKTETQDTLTPIESIGDCINAVDSLNDIWLKQTGEISNPKQLNELILPLGITCFEGQNMSEQKSLSKSCWGENNCEVINDEKEDLLKKVNKSVLDTINNDLVCAPFDIFGEVASYVPEQNPEIGLKNWDNLETNHDIFLNNHSDLIPQEEIQPHVDSSHLETLQKNLSYINSDNFDFESFLNSPERLASSSDDKKTLKSLTDLDSTQRREKSVAYVENFDDKGSENITINNNDEKLSWAQTHNPEMQNWTISKKMHGKISQNSKMNLISVRKVKYVSNGLNIDPSSGSASETICFATQPAAKTFNKRYGKKFVYKPSKIFKNSTSTQENDATSIVSKNSDESFSAVVLPIGETGCSASIPAYTSLDIYSFSPQSLQQTPQNEHTFLDLKPQPGLNSSNNVQIFPVCSSNKVNGWDDSKSIPQVKCHNIYSTCDIKKPLRTTNNAGSFIDLKNVMKIEIYTKPPKKIVITKCNNNQTESKMTSVGLEKIKTNSPTGLLNKFIGLLQKSIPDLSEDLLKQLCLPIDAVRRSYLTNLEIICLRRQTHLLKMIKKVKVAHNLTCPSPCLGCDKVKSMTSELEELQKWKYNNIIKTKTWRTLQEHCDSLNVNPSDGGFDSTNEKRRWCEPLISNHISTNSWIANKINGFEKERISKQDCK